MKENIWDKFEQASDDGYHNDPRWKMVQKLRKEGNQLGANSLVSKIREDWGVE